jgi:hypothetical protein
MCCIGSWFVALDLSVTYDVRVPIEAIQRTYSDESTAVGLDSKAARLGSGRAVRHTLCELDQKLLLAPDAVKQQLDVVAIHLRLRFPSSVPYRRECIRCRRNSPIASSTLDALCADGSRA